MGYRLNHLEESVFMAVSKPLLTEFGIHPRLESCAPLSPQIWTRQLSFLLSFFSSRPLQLHRPVGVADPPVPWVDGRGGAHPGDVDRHTRGLRTGEGRRRHAHVLLPGNTLKKILTWMGQISTTYLIWHLVNLRGNEWVIWISHFQISASIRNLKAMLNQCF